MKNIITVVVISLLCAVSVIGQKTTLPPGVKSMELLSPFVEDPSGKRVRVDQSRRLMMCLDLVVLEHGCDRNVTIDYGTRMGVNRDLFKVNGGRVDRSRMLLVGPYRWTDKFTVPYVEPWSELAPGERRHITFNVSGGDGADGKPGTHGIAGMNGDGTYTQMVVPPRPTPTQASAKAKRKDYGSADVKEQVSSRVVSKDGKARMDGYTPLVVAKKDHMYVVHLVDEGRDYYVLIRVDEVITGDRIKISFLKLVLTEAL